MSKELVPTTPRQPQTSTGRTPLPSAPAPSSPNPVVKPLHQR